MGKKSPTQLKSGRAAIFQVEDSAKERSDTCQEPDPLSNVHHLATNYQSLALERTILSPTSHIYHSSSYLPSTYNLTPLRKELDTYSGWVQPILLFGNATPRYVAWFGPFEYTYTRHTHPKQSFPPQLEQLRKKLQQDLGVELNTCLVNKYRKDKQMDGNGKWASGAGKDSIGPHRDNEGPMGPYPTIVSFTLGAKRKFTIRPYKKQPPPPSEKILQSNASFDLGENSLLVMAGNTNAYFEHQVPKELTREITDDRYNLTFRWIDPEYVEPAKGRKRVHNQTRSDSRKKRKKSA